MSQMGQTEKNSLRANVFWVTPESGHCSMQSACLKGANSGRRRMLVPNHGSASLPSRVICIDIFASTFTFRQNFRALGSAPTARAGDVDVWEKSMHARLGKTYQ